MAVKQQVLLLVPIPGLRADGLGNYLASLGLLRALARRWSTVRASWRLNDLQIVGGPRCVDELLDALCDVAAGSEWAPYERGWAVAQKRGTKTKSGAPLALWRTSADEAALEIFDAHAVPGSRVSFNHLLGSGGNAGKREFAKGWKQATDALATSERSMVRAELHALFRGEPLTWRLEKLNAASWFSDANKIYNSGQRPYAEGALSPWVMALACEGLAFFAGGPSRRLGARTRTTGAFPFVVEAAAPCAAGEAGHDLAEVWAPLWERPMTVCEITTLFRRGRAEIHGRGASTPSAFAASIMHRGVDAGITEFRRFVLARTTSANTFEPRFEGTIRVGSADTSSKSAPIELSISTSVVFEHLLSLLNRFPADRKVGKRWQFVGLRGPLESAMLTAAASPTSSEAACAMLDAATSALDRVDRNKSFRKRRISWTPLPIEWLPNLFGDNVPGVEARLALALVSAFPVAHPFTIYRFGAELEYGRRFVHSERQPARWVWQSGQLPQVLSATLHRRNLDWEAAGSAANDDELPVRAQLPASPAHVERWLHNAIDDSLFAQWLSRLALFDWGTVPFGLRKLATSTSGTGESALLCLYGLFHPLFDLRPITGSKDQSRRNLLPRESGARTSAAARRIAGLLRSGDVTTATRVAASRFATAGISFMETAASWQVDDPGRLIASLLFPIFDNERAALLERWLRPRRTERKVSYV